MFKYDVHYPIKNKAKNLVIFLHGYNGCIADHQYAIDWLNEYLNASCVIVPEAPDVCDKNPNKKQWFGMLKYDVNNVRSLPETSVFQIFSIYQKAANDVDKRANEINSFIDDMQKKYGFDDEHTFLIGFSQGAMLSLYTALTRCKKLGGAFVIAGLAVARKTLAKKICSRPDLYLFHGKDDLKVQYKTLNSTKRWLQRNEIVPHVYTYGGLAHRVAEDEINVIASVINNKF